MHLLPQFLNRARSRAGYRLIAGCEDAPHTKAPVQRINCHQGDSGRAIWIRDDPLVLVYILAVDFRDNQRHIGFHPESRRIVDDDGAGTLGQGSKLARDFASCAKKCDIDVLERFFVQARNAVHFVTKRERFARGTSRTDCFQTGCRKVSALQNAQKLCAYGAGRADYGDVIAFIQEQAQFNPAMVSCNAP